jgi:hypothetical protein
MKLVEKNRNSYINTNVFSMGISLLCNAVECGSYVPSRHFFSKEGLKDPDRIAGHWYSWISFY